MAKPKLALIPAAQGDKFYSVLPSDGVGDFDFTRNSSATRIAPTGFIETSELFGSDLLSGYDFTSGWVLYSGATSTSNSFTGFNNSGIYKSILVSGKTYKMVIAGNTTSANGASVSDFPETQNYKSVSSGAFSETFYFQANGTNLFLTNNSLGTTTFTTLSLQEQIGKSRLDYDLLNGKVVNCPHYLLEPASTNLIAYSEDFSNVYWTKGTNGSGSVTINQNAITSPDGTLNADEIVIVGGAGNLQFVYRNITGLTITNGNKYNTSVYVKGQGTIDLIFRFGGGAQGSTVQRLTLSNTWVRHNITLTATGTASNAEVFFQSQTGATSTNFYAWGFQVEALSYPTSYIPTNGTAITRAAESANGSGNAATFNDSEGVLMAEIAALANDLTFRLIALKGTSDDIRFGYRTTSNAIYVDAPNAFLVATVNDIKTYNKVAIKYGATGTKFFINGFELGVDADDSSFSGIDTLDFDATGSSNYFFGKTRELQYFDSALTDAQLETLTSWTSLQEMITSQLYTNY